MKNRLPKELQEFEEDLAPALEELAKILSSFAQEGQFSAEGLLAVLSKAVPMRYAVLSEDGEVMECDVASWAQFLEKGRAQRILVQEHLPNGYLISTIFLGLNHQYFRDAPPLWFETMIFSPPTGQKSLITGKEDRLGPEVFCERYSTLSEALAGHQRAKEKFLAQAR
jgi:hypothetical protein